MATRNSCYKVILPNVSMWVQDRLDSDFLKEELFATLCSMQNENSPSMNGLPCKFYKAMWDTIGDDFVAWHLRPSPQDFNQGLIKLIPKNASRDSTGG
jgi:hypothetical protein